VNYFNSFEFALQLDANDPLRTYREKFFIPQHEDHDCIYLCGNSLGLQPRTAQNYISLELQKWQDHGVEGHFAGKEPWVTYHKTTKDTLGKVLGAQKNEVVSMGSLTANLHFLLVSFYRPSAKKFKILTESGSFPSDIYALESQVKYHGYDPMEAILEIKPRNGEHTLRSEDILNIIRENQEEIALVMMSGVQYYTGQYFEIDKITFEAHNYNIPVGFDLAHAVGNVPLKLHEWGVDFATWCSYKYLNSGPGGTAGIFIHEKHGNNYDLPRFAGWWGHKEGERFQMKNGFIPMDGVDGWQLSNVNIISTAVHRCSLEIFEEAGMEVLREKSLTLTGFLEFLINEINKEKKLIKVITPSNPIHRGCQLSLVIPNVGKKVFEIISARGIIADWREPDVIRIAPVPLYNTYSDVFKFSQILKEALFEVDKENIDA
jgi:kynureninase